VYEGVAVAGGGELKGSEGERVGMGSLCDFLLYLHGVTFFRLHGYEDVCVHEYLRRSSF
jgi:hypothetical protein